MTDGPQWKPYIIFKSALHPYICQLIVHLHEHLSYSEGGVLTKKAKATGKADYNKAHRHVKLQGSEVEWVNSLLVGYTRLANHKTFNYNLTDVDKERLQFSKYEEGMFFNDHMDYDGDPSTSAHTRKLSVTVQLSDPSTYTGGDLIIDHCENGPFTCPKDIGTVIVFDSRWFHKVTPVKSGFRYSLVKWVHGDTPLR